MFRDNNHLHSSYSGNIHTPISAFMLKKIKVLLNELSIITTCQYSERPPFCPEHVNNYKSLAISCSQSLAIIINYFFINNAF